MCKESQTKIAGLESQIDVLESELMNLNEMLVHCGFSEGIKTLKETMVEMMQEEKVSQE